MLKARHILLLGLLFVGCGGHSPPEPGMDAEGPPTFPFFCDCSCIRCIQRDPQTLECLMMGRQAFSLTACAADAEAAPAACAAACGRFGTDCMTQAGLLASDTPCP